MTGQCERHRRHADPRRPGGEPRALGAGRGRTSGPPKPPSAATERSYRCTSRNVLPAIVAGSTAATSRPTAVARRIENASFSVVPGNLWTDDFKMWVVGCRGPGNATAPPLRTDLRRGEDQRRTAGIHVGYSGLRAWAARRRAPAHPAGAASRGHTQSGGRPAPGSANRPVVGPTGRSGSPPRVNPSGFRRRNVERASEGFQHLQRLAELGRGFASLELHKKSQTDPGGAREFVLPQSGSLAGRPYHVTDLGRRQDSLRHDGFTDREYRTAGRTASTEIYRSVQFQENSKSGWAFGLPWPALHGSLPGRRLVACPDGPWIGLLIGVE